MRKSRIVTLVLLSLVLLSSSVFAQDFSGDVTAVSAYVWRGILNTTGVEIQGTVSGAYKALSYGIWYSSVGSGSIETDPFVEVALPTGEFESTIGLTMYNYDLTFEDEASKEFEVYAKAGFKGIGVSAFFVPSQASTEGDDNESNYWIEASYGFSALSTDFGLTYGMGTYSSRWVDEPTKDAVSCLLISASKSISESVSVSYNYSLGLDDYMNDYLYVTLGLSF